MISKKDLGFLIYQRSYIRGKFILRSGKESTEYFDKYRFLSTPYLINEIANHIAKDFILPSPYALAYMSMGAIVLASSLSNLMQCDSLFIRKEAKEYGTRRMIEGNYPDIDQLYDRYIGIVEDVITTGGAVSKGIYALNNLGATVDSIYCIIDRSNGVIDRIEGIKVRGLFTMEELKNYGLRK